MPTHTIRKGVNIISIHEHKRSPMCHRKWRHVVRIFPRARAGGVTKTGVDTLVSSRLLRSSDEMAINLLKVPGSLAQIILR